HKERDREGKALKKELLHLLSQLKKSLKTVESMTESIRKELEKRFGDRLSQFSTGIDIDPQRVAQEVAVALDKCDIREEISRLDEHLSMFQSLVDNDSEPRGKKLDFYCQELLREFNTIGSKSSQAKLTQTVVDAKSIIEKLREQVQNIE
ncbi:MAG: DUF1732 domain-containing protein, partial [Bdellovibrionales bacterium]|nr:DUF1732 domain-containing protein [Bdellovibrionales bacterium]